MVLEIVETWGWYSWRELDSNVQLVRWSGQQNLHSEQEARDHHTRTSGRTPDEIRLCSEA